MTNKHHWPTTSPEATHYSVASLWKYVFVYSISFRPCSAHFFTALSAMHTDKKRLEYCDKLYMFTIVLFWSNDDNMFLNSVLNAYKMKADAGFTSFSAMTNSFAIQSLLCCLRRSLAIPFQVSYSNYIWFEQRPQHKVKMLYVWKTADVALKKNSFFTETQRLELKENITLQQLHCFFLKQLVLHFIFCSVCSTKILFFWKTSHHFQKASSSSSLQMTSLQFLSTFNLQKKSYLI